MSGSFEPQQPARLVAKADITLDLVSQLVAAQFPRWADLPITPVDLDGWDNTTFRLGSTMSVRLPSHDHYVPQVDKEHQWLPMLAPHLPLPIPVPLARAEPTPRFPRPWSIYRWLEGEPASVERIDDLERFASDLAGFLLDLYRVDTSSGPAAGPHSFSRGGPVATWDSETRLTIAALDQEIDAPAARAVWDAAVAAGTWDTPVWVHGDVTGANLLVSSGRLAAVIDFGCCAVGDPACDLTIAWTLFSDTSRERFRRALVFDDATWARARGWALWKALVTFHRTHTIGGAADLAGAQFGWRPSPRKVIDEVLADHDQGV